MTTQSTQQPAPIQIVELVGIRTDIVQAVSQGWCTPECLDIEMDSRLVIAICRNVQAVFERDLAAPSIPAQQQAGSELPDATAHYGIESFYDKGMPATQQQAKPTDLHAEIMNLQRWGGGESDPEVRERPSGEFIMREEVLALLPSEVQERAVNVPEPRVREIATTAALAVAKNAGVAEQLCFPHIYLTLKGALATTPAAPPAREFITLNRAQIMGLLEATDGDDDLDPTEITLITHAEPFKSTDGEDMPAGVYFYWSEYPEEGIVHLTAPHGESDKTAGEAA